ncbi:unnamed protein product [Phaeothamnion confervicola]
MNRCPSSTLPKLCPSFFLRYAILPEALAGAGGTFCSAPRRQMELQPRSVVTPSFFSVAHRWALVASVPTHGPVRPRPRKLKTEQETLKKANEMGTKTKALQADLQKLNIEGTGAGGKVKVFVTGQQMPCGCEIDPSMMSGSPEALQEAVVEAMSNAHKEVRNNPPLFLHRSSPCLSAQSFRVKQSAMGVRCRGTVLLGWGRHSCVMLSVNCSLLRDLPGSLRAHRHLLFSAEQGPFLLRSVL